MSWLGVLGVIISFCWFGAVPAHGQGCCHHNHHYDDADCWDGDHCWHQGAPAGRYFRGPGSSPGAANAQTVEGKIAEVVYLPGATVESGMVEVRRRRWHPSGSVSRTCRRPGRCRGPPRPQSRSGRNPPASAASSPWLARRNSSRSSNRRTAARARFGAPAPIPRGQADKPRPAIWPCFSGK